MKDVIVYKLGHNYLNSNHTYSDGIFKAYLSSSDKSSPYYSPKNQYQSEFSAIAELLEKDIPHEYIGVCHYRTLLGDVSQHYDYATALKISEELILKSLETHDGICSQNYPSKFINLISRPRWTGSKSLEYLVKALEKVHPDLIQEFADYLITNDNSYRTVCVLPKNEFYTLFNDVLMIAPTITKLRKDNNDLYPRSVGYELETFTSFLLVRLSKRINLDRLKNTVLIHI